MNEPDEPQREKMTGVEIIKFYGDKFGYLTFGVVTFIILWMLVLNPQLTRRDLDFDNQRKVIESLNRMLDTQQVIVKDQERLSATLSSTASTMKDAATILKVVSEQMEANTIGRE